MWCTATLWLRPHGAPLFAMAALGSVSGPFSLPLSSDSVLPCWLQRSMWSATAGLAVVYLMREMRLFDLGELRAVDAVHGAGGHYVKVVLNR